MNNIILASVKQLEIENVLDDMELALMVCRDSKQSYELAKNIKSFQVSE